MANALIRELELGTARGLRAGTDSTVVGRRRNVPLISIAGLE